MDLAADRGLAARLLHDAGGGRFRFAHGLVRTALAGQVPLQQSVVRHIRAAHAGAHRSATPAVG